MHARYTADEKGGAGSNKTRWMIVAGREPDWLPSETDVAKDIVDAVE